MKPRTKTQRTKQERPFTYPSAVPVPPETRRQRWTWGAVLWALVVVAYLPVVRAGFIWDDETYVVGNQALRTGAGLARIWLDTSTVRQYYPLVHTTFWVEYHLWGLHPLGYHIVNVLLHGASALLLWRLLVYLRIPGAWFAAAIFAVHPVMVESVAWVTERKNVLSLTLALLSLHAYVRFAPVDDAETSRATISRYRWRWYGLSLALFLAALLSKTVVSTLPAVILVIDWWRRGKLSWRDVLPLIPFFLLGIGLGLLTVMLERNSVGAIGKEFNFSLADRLLIAGRALWFYAGKLAWPNPLVFFYPRFAIDDHAWWQYLFPLGACAALAVLWWHREWWGRGPLAAVLIFAGILFPALGFFNVYPFRYSFVADHFQYHACIALLVLAAAGATRAVALLPQTAKRLAPVAAGILLLSLAGLSFSQSLVYRDLETLYHDTIAKNPQGWMAYGNLGVYVESLGRHDEAFGYFQKAMELNPQDANMQTNMGHILLKLGERDGFKPGQLDEAMEHFNKALALDPNCISARRGLGFALYHGKRYSEAIEQFARTLKLRPDDPDSLSGSGAVLGAAGRHKEAEECFRRALAIDPNYYEALRGLALICMQQGRTAEAAQYLNETIRLRPAYAEAHFDLANIYAQRRNFQGAADHYLNTVRLQPRYAEAWHRLGMAYGDLGDMDRAVDCFKETLRLDPKITAAQANLQKAQQLKEKQAAK